ncbi:MAG: LysR family transcriptional regulator, partial [Dialister hominis]|nr:LysR family transcriptional regulator [Dialister hominis]
MDVEVLNHFLTVVREENISRAAERLHVTQPTLSRQMAALEEELGTQLFIRGKHLQLTDAGVLLRGRAEEVTQIIDKIRMEFKAGEELSGVVSIGTGGLMSAQILSKLISEFRALHPAVRFNIYTNSADHLREQLDRGLLDFAFLLEPVDIGKYDFVRMQVKERWGILMPKGHPLEEKPLISRKDLLH